MAEGYEKRTGHAVRDLAFYETYAALRHGIVMTRVTARAVHFGQSEWPPNADDVIPHKAVLERMLDGSFWS